MNRKWLDNIYADIAFAIGGLVITLSWLPAWYSVIPGLFTLGWVIQAYKRISSRRETGKPGSNGEARD
ncbi:hypothetical protein [Streptomyces sp. NPDC051572]|uniref:hypothetical protein n=1 Tax=Streptomyces sp. NPDC051572 TaxID=3155802 RepID=UPI00344CB805